MTQDRTRASYDAVAAAYAEALSDELEGKPLDRALLAVFAEQVREVGRGESRVWDVGCGPGHVTAFLAGLGLRAAGIDVSGEMIDQAAKRHPDLEFSTGSMTALPAAGASWDGLVSFYSLIHMIDDGDVRAVAEIAGVMAAKKTSDLIPLCHPLALSKVEVSVEPAEGGLAVMARVKLKGQTGVEMEAMTAVSVALLTIYDMAKALDKGMAIGDIRLLSKTGGKSGDWRAT